MKSQQISKNLDKITKKLKNKIKPGMVFRTLSELTQTKKRYFCGAPNSIKTK